MDRILEDIAQALVRGRRHIHENLTGKVCYGTFCHDPSIIGRINEDGSETFGRFSGADGQFVPFTEEEDADFKRQFAWHFTKIFNKDNVIQFPVRKRSPT
jgi:hypothetical protein